MGMDEQKDGQVVSRFQSGKAGMRPLFAWLIVSALVLGFFVGRVASDGPGASAAASEPDATATRSAEVAELDALRTQVAQQPSACPETPVVTPTLVPAGEMDQPYSYTDAWTVIVHDAQPVTAPAEVKPNGALLRVNLTLANNGSKRELFPFLDLVLVDSQNRTFLVSLGGSNAIIGADWNFFIDPSIPVDKSVIFDVATDAGTSFVLQSTSEPTFRVNVEVVQRG
jgi:hypothetical protein